MNSTAPMISGLLKIHKENAPIRPVINWRSGRAYKLAKTLTKNFKVYTTPIYILSFSILSDDRSKDSSKTIPPHSAIQSFLLQMRVSSPVLKVIQ